MQKRVNREDRQAFYTQCTLRANTSASTFLFSSGSSTLYFSLPVIILCRLLARRRKAEDSRATLECFYFCQAPFLHSSALTFRDASANSGQGLVRTWVNLISGSVIWAVCFVCERSFLFRPRLFRSCIPGCLVCCCLALLTCMQVRGAKTGYSPVSNPMLLHGRKGMAGTSGRLCSVRVIRI